MARIQITDLPLLEDLTPEQLKELFGAGAKAFKPSFEALEDRQLMSGFSSLLTAVQAPAFSAPAASTAAPVAITLNQPIQVISTDPYAPVAINLNQQIIPGDPVAPVASNLNQSIQVIPVDPIAPVAINLNQLIPSDPIAPVAINLNQQIIPGDPVAPVAINLNQSVQGIPVDSVALQTQASPAAALQQAATSATIQQKNPVSAAAYDPGELDTTTPPVGDRVLDLRTDNLQEQGRIAIKNKVTTLGAYLGKPLGESQATKDGMGRYQTFENGKYIIWSQDTGARLVEGLIGEEFIKAGGISKRGYPKYDALPLPGWPGAVVQDFWIRASQASSSIVWSAPTGAQTISDAIWKKWIDLGAGDYGLPLNDQYQTHGAISQDFMWRRPGGPVATIVWSARFGAHDVVGVMRDKWISFGRENRGLPVRDQTVAGSGSVRRIIDFVKSTRVINDDGSEGWTEDWSAIALHDPNLPFATESATIIYGDIYYAWNSFGRELTTGVPVNDEADGLVEGGRIQFFYNEVLRRSDAIEWEAGTILTDYDGVLKATSFKRGPPRFESTGTTSAGLTADPTLNLRDLVQVSTHATDTTGLHSLDLSGLVQNSTHATANLPSAISTVASTPSLLQSSAALFETEAIGGNRAIYIPPGPHFPLGVASDQVSSDADIASIYEPFVPDIGLWPEYTPGPAIPPVLAQADIARANPMADFSNVNFSLTSLDTGEVHQLQMQSQSNWLPAGTADRQRLPGPSVGTADRQQVPGASQETITFIALWDPANDGGFQATGTLSHDDAGIIHIQFNWGSLESGTFHTFIGTVTGEAGSYHIDGTNIARPDGVADPMAGDQTPPALVSAVEDLTAATFTLTWPDGTTHQLAIQAQTGQADGSATFTGVWDAQNADGGATAAGTLVHDDAGNIHITFSLSDGNSVDGTISGQPGTHHLEAVMTPADGSSPSQVVGDQDQQVDGAVPGPVLLADSAILATPSTQLPPDAGNLPSDLVAAEVLSADPGMPADPSTLPMDAGTQPFDQVALLADPGILPAPSTQLAADSATLVTEPVAPLPLPADLGLATQVQTAPG